jgi:hypothetical protein
MRFLLVTTDAARGHIAEDYGTAEDAHAALMRRLHGVHYCDRMTSTLMAVRADNPPAFVWSRIDYGTGR